MSGTLLRRRLTAAVVTIAFVAGAAIVVTTSPTPVSASDHDDPTAIALRDGLASFVENLAGVAAHEPLAEPVPLTPVDIATLLDLDVALGMLADEVSAAGVTFEELEQSLDDGIELGDGAVTLVGAIDRTSTPHVVTLVLSLAHTTDVPIAVGTDLLGLTGDGPSLAIGLEAGATLEFDPTALDGPNPSNALAVRVSGADAATIDFTAGLEAEWDSSEPLAANVGILAVTATGTAESTVAVGAAFNAAAGDQVLDRGTWESTSGLDLFTTPNLSATAQANLQVSSTITGLETPSTLSLDWDLADGPTNWRDALDVDLGPIGDFDNIFIEEVMMGIAELATTLRGAQVSGAADLPLPFTQSRVSDLDVLKLHQPFLDWFDGHGFAETPENGPTILLAGLDRALLTEAGLLDVESVLASLADELGFDPELSYDPAEQVLSFGVSYSRALDGQAAPTIGVQIGDIFAVDGLRNLRADGTAQLTVEPAVDVALDLGLSLEFDPERFAEDPDPEVLLAIGDRLTIDTTGSGIELDFPADATLQLAGSIGFVGISATTGDSPILRPKEDGPMLSASFQGDGDIITLNDLFNNLVPQAVGEGEDPEQSSVVAAINVQVPDVTLTVSVSPAIAGASSGTAVLSWPDITTSAPVLDTSGLGSLMDFHALDTDDPLALLSHLLDALDQILANLGSELVGQGGFEIPIVGGDLAQVVADIAEARDRLHDLTADPASTVQGFADQLVAELGLSENPGVSLEIDMSGPAPALIVRVDKEIGDTLQLPFQLSAVDIPLVGLAADGNIETGYQAALAVHTRIELPSTPGGTPEVFVLTSSGAKAALAVTIDPADQVSVGVNAGPWTLSVGGVDDDDEPRFISASVDASITAGMAATPVATDVASWVATLASPTVEGSVAATLPVLFNDQHLGDIGISGNLPSPTITGADDVFANLADAVLDEIFSFRMLAEGLRYIADLIDSKLDGGRLGVKVPIVGEALDGGAELANMLAGLADQIEAALDALPDDADALEAELNNIFDGAFGDLGSITIAVDCGGSCAGKHSAEITEVVVTLELGQEIGAELPGFDLGIPGLRLGIESADAGPIAEATIDWGINLALVLNEDGLFLRPGDDPLVEAGTTVEAADKLFGHLAFLLIEMDDNSSDPELDLGVEVTLDPGDIALHQIVGGNVGVSVDFGVNVDIDRSLKTVADIPGTNFGDVMPAILADLIVAWTWDGGSPSLDDFTIALNNVGIAPSEFVNGLLEPILGELKRFTDPLQPVIDVLNTPIPVISDISEALTGKKVTLLTIVAEAADFDATMLESIFEIVQLASALGSGDGTVVNLGSIDLDPGKAMTRAYAPNEVADQLIVGSPPESNFFDGLPASVTSSVGDETSGFSYPAFQDTSNIFKLLLGEDVTLVDWRSGPLKGSVGTEILLGVIPIPPLPATVTISLKLSASIEGRVAIGYDTYGIRRSVEAFTKGGDIGQGIELLFHGVYVDDFDQNGNDVPEIVVSGFVGIVGALDVGIARGGLEGGLQATLSMDLRDELHNGDGKIRLREMLEHAGFYTPICLFKVDGALSLLIKAFATIGRGFLSFTISKTLINIVLLSIEDITGDACADKPPQLADVYDINGGNVLVLHAGPLADRRNLLPGEENEEFVVRPLNEAHTKFSVAAFGAYEEYDLGANPGTTIAGRDVRVIADGGTGDDVLTMADGWDKLADDITFDADSDDAIPFNASVLLCGGSGNDTLTGGYASDILIGDGVGDSFCITSSGGGVSLDANVHNPTEHASNGNDKLYGVGGDNLMFGLGGDDELYGGAGSDFLVGGSGNDLLTVPGENTAGSILIGGSRLPEDVPNPGYDTLTGGGGPDIIIADNGDVESDGSIVVGLDHFGGNSNEVPPYNIADGGPGKDRILGGPGNDELYGGPGDDFIDGGAGNDIVVGGSADDASDPQLSGSAGTNVLVGGPGNDVVFGHHADVERRPDGLAFDAGDVKGGLPAGVGSTPALLIGGSLYDDPNPGNDTAWGGGGNDLIVGDGAIPVSALRPTVDNGSVTYPAALDASAFAALRATDGDSVPTGLELLHEHGGNDRLHGGPGNDSIWGGAGHDILIGGWPIAGTATGQNLLVGGRGNDVLVGGNGRVIDHAGTDAPDVTILHSPTPAVPPTNRLIGGSWDDLDEPGDDWLYAGRFGDVMIGDNGEISAGLTADVYLTHGGNDHIFGSLGHDRGFGGPGDDLMRGGPGDDILEGGPGNDELHGDSGNDILIGGSSRPGIPSGNDKLFGGFGTDALAGDNARIVQLDPDDPREGLHDSRYVVELYDLPGAGNLPPAETDGNDLLSGGLGNDLLYGQNGDDEMYGDGGDDFLQGGPGEDELYGGPGNAALVGGSAVHVVFDDAWPLLEADVDPPSDVTIHRVPAPDPGALGWDVEELDGISDTDDLLVGGQGDDAMAGDNARIERDGSGGWEVTLFDVAYAGEPAPHLDTFGDDVLIGGSIGAVGNPGDDLGFGQGGDDLLLGDNAVAVGDARKYAPLHGASDGDDHLEGGPGDDTLFGNGGDDVLIGGSSDLGIADAATRGVVAGSDLIVGGPGDDYGLGDNGRVDFPAPWWATGVGGASVTLFDEKVDGGALPHPDTAGNDLLIGGSLHGNAPLLGMQLALVHPGHDLMHGQVGDDLLFGDDVIVDETMIDWADGWHAVFPDVSQPLTNWQIATFDWVDHEGGEAADGGDDLLLGGADDDIIFGGPGQDDIIGGSWEADRHDGRDLVDGGPGHDVIAGDNATIVRPFDAATDTFTCQTYRHRHGNVGAWEDATEGGFEFACAVGTPDADADNGVYTRVVRAAAMLDTAPGVTSGSDLVWGNHGDDDITGQFDDTDEFDDGAWSGLPTWRLVEWCRLDQHLGALIAAGALDVADLELGDTMADYLAFYGFDIDDVFFGGDVLCGGAGEDAILGDQGVVDDVVEDGAREEVIAPQQPFMDALIFAEGTLTRQVTLTQWEIGGDDVILGGDDGDWLHGGAGDDLVNGNAGDDRIFGGDGDDAVWGGAGDDHLYGGHGDDDLDVRPRTSKPASGPGNPNRPPEHPGDPAERFLLAVEGDSYDGFDHIYGGWDRDVMQADEGDNGPVAGARLIDWGGVYNLWYNCPATYGAWIDIRSPYPGLQQYLIDQAHGDGAFDPGTQGTSGFNELALVYQQDIRHNTSPPHPETPGHFTCGAADGT